MLQDLTSESENEAQFMKVYENYADGIFRYCLFRVWDKELARDLTQEAFCRAWFQLAEGKDIDNLRAFVYKVARNLIIDNSRKRKDVSLDQMLDDAKISLPATSANQVESYVDGRLLLRSLEQLDEQYKEVVMLRYIEEMTPAEIAEVLGEKANAVSIRINRGISKLRELING